MSRIQSFDRSTCNAVSSEAMEALQAVAERYGLSLNRQPGRYSEGNFTFKCEFKVVSDSGVPADFAQKAAVLGLPEDCFGQVFNSRGRSYKITGLNLRRRKYPVSAVCVESGRGFKFAAHDVKAFLMMKKAS